MDAYQKERAEIALRRLESEKDIKRHKLNEHLQNVRLSLLLRLPYKVIKSHNTCKMSVSQINGFVRMSFPDGYIPIRLFLQRSDSPTFENWLSANYPEEFERYQADKMRFLFGTNTELKHTDSAQVLCDEFDRYTWYKNEQERQYYFSGLLQDADIPSMSEFDLFGTADGSHSVQEISDFKSELLDMQRKYAEHPDRFFHPVEDTADSPAAVI